MTNRPEISPAIAKLLMQLRRRIRGYVWLEGLAMVVAALGAAFWVMLVLDWIFEPSPAVRSVLFVLLGIGLAVLVYRALLRRVFVPLSDISLAILLERYGKSFEDSLLTSVELTANAEQRSDFNQEMLAHTSMLASEKSGQVRLTDVFTFRPLIKVLLLALVMVVSITGFALASQDAFGFYVKRLRLSPDRWPRSTRLLVEGFPADEDGVRRIKVAKGGNYTLTIKADNSSDYEIPQRVEVLYTLDEGSRGRADAKRIGNAVAGLDPFQEFQFTFENLHDSHTFDVVGRDAGVILGLRDERIRSLRLEVVDSPTVQQKLIDVKYPTYMARTPATLEATAAMQLPRGAKLTIHAQANKNLTKVRIEDSALPEPVEFEIPAEQTERKKFDYVIDNLDADRVLHFSLTDEDGITTADQDRDRLSILAIEDEPPQVTVRLEGIGQAITPSANIPLTGKIVDDYGVGQWWFEHRTGTDDAKQTPLANAPGGRQTLEFAEALDVRPLELQPQQSFTLWLKTLDQHDLGMGPNEGLSTRFELKVVTPEDLRGILDRDELRLRQRFEAVYEEMLRTRDLLARIEYGSPTEKPDNSEPVSSEPAEESTPEATDKPNNSAETAKTVDPAEQAERLAARRRLQLMKALHYVERGSHDTLSVATGFDEIFAQMINNRIDSVDAQQRLVEDIAKPLKSIGGPQMQELTTQLEKLRVMPAEDTSGEPQWRVAIQQADDVLVEMKSVLDRMQQLGNFSEIAELLRSILTDQDQIISETKQQRVKSTRSLLED